MNYCDKYQNVTERKRVSKCYWKDGANRLAPHRVATKTSLFFFFKKKVQPLVRDLRSHKLHGMAKKEK